MGGSSRTRHHPHSERAISRRFGDKKPPPNRHIRNNWNESGTNSGRIADSLILSQGVGPRSRESYQIG